MLCDGVASDLAFLYVSPELKSVFLKSRRYRQESEIGKERSMTALDCTFEKLEPQGYLIVAANAGSSYNVSHSRPTCTVFYYTSSYIEDT